MLKKLTAISLILVMLLSYVPFVSFVPVIDTSAAPGDPYEFIVCAWDMNPGPNSTTAKPAGELLADNNTDLAGLQFVKYASRANTIQSAAKMNYGQWIETDPAPQGNVSLFKLEEDKSLRQITSLTTNGMEGRKLQKNVLILPNGQKLSFYNTHLTPSGGLDLLETQIDEVLEFMRQDGNPYKVLTATFNTQNKDQFQKFIDKGYNLARGGELVDIVFSNNIKKISAKAYQPDNMAEYTLPTSNKDLDNRPWFVKLGIYPVTGVTVKPASVRLAPGDKYTLSAEIMPAEAINKNVTWSSGDISVATVDVNGVVTAQSQGRATITATTVEGGKKGTCEVIVVGLCAGFSKFPRCAPEGQYIYIEAEIIKGNNINFSWDISGAGYVEYINPIGSVISDGGSSGSFLMSGERQTLGAWFQMISDNVDVELLLQNGNNTNHKENTKRLFGKIINIDDILTVEIKYDELTNQFPVRVYADENENEEEGEDVHVHVFTLTRPLFPNYDDEPNQRSYGENTDVNNPRKLNFEKAFGENWMQIIFPETQRYFCGNEECTGHEAENTAIEWFSDIWELYCNIYNGTKVINQEETSPAPLEDEEYDNDKGDDKEDESGDEELDEGEFEEGQDDVDENVANEKTMTFEWDSGIDFEKEDENGESGFEVYRLMYNTGSENPAEPQRVPGQYKRGGKLSYFNEDGEENVGLKNQATVSWKRLTSQDSFYRYDIDKAKNASNPSDGSGFYRQAVFSTDKYLQDNLDTYPNPIKSGYYFNPGGTYVCTITTTRFLEGDYNDREEHNNIVIAAIKSFVYKSPLTYVKRNGHGNHDTYKLNKLTFDSVSKAASFFDCNREDLLDYEIGSSEEYSNDREDFIEVKNICDVLKALLEGYEESGTISSLDDYNYREYPYEYSEEYHPYGIKAIYRVEEQTTVIITVAPGILPLDNETYEPEETETEDIEPNDEEDEMETGESGNESLEPHIYPGLKRLYTSVNMPNFTSKIGENGVLTNAILVEIDTEKFYSKLEALENSRRNDESGEQKESIEITRQETIDEPLDSFPLSVCGSLYDDLDW